MANRKMVNRRELNRRLLEIQVRTWRARNMAQVIREALELHLDDPQAALEGLVDYLDQLHDSADPGWVMFGPQEAPTTRRRLEVANG